MTTYYLEMLNGQPRRQVDAHYWELKEGWMVFYRRPAQGGAKEYWRVRIEHVVSMETGE